jgi:4-diphosphocytidyl-2-C-methyl-D-erythritol kinase
LRRTFARLPVLGHMMSGSGTSYFGICTQRKHARTVAARLNATRIGSVFTVESRP